MIDRASKTASLGFLSFHKRAIYLGSVTNREKFIDTDSLNHRIKS